MSLLRIKFYSVMQKNAMYQHKSGLIHTYGYITIIHPTYIRIMPFDWLYSALLLSNFKFVPNRNSPTNIEVNDKYHFVK
jgi:hypothetical protein